MSVDSVSGASLVDSDGLSGGAGEPVAVIGAACRAPGGVDSLAALWRLLAEGRETVGPVPKGRWDVEALVAELPEHVACRIRRGGFLDGDLAAFDAQAFGISGQEARWLDPQHRLLLMLAWEACEHAGIPVEALRGSQTGVFAGMYWMDNYLRGHRAPQDSEAYWFAGGMHGVGVGRVSYLMDLHGPSLSVDTACSSSLVATHLACQSLRAGECTVALAAGVSAGIGPEVSVASAGYELFSPTGRCRPFDKDADGYLRAEGAGVLVLKLLKDARRDGDRVLAVLRGSAVNQDGRSVRLTAPSAKAQAAVFATALRRAGVNGEQVGMIEAHGTGTPVGDPLEFSALKEVYGAGAHRCAIGSIKTNIGHTEPASGVMGLLKAIASLQHGQVPATLHFTEFNPQIDASDCRLYVPTQMEPWPVPHGPRLAAVCSYGVGGTNAHVVLEAGDAAVAREAPEEADATGEWATFLLSASTPAAVRRHATGLADWLEGDDGNRVPLRDVAHTLAVRRSHAAHRAAAVARSRGELVSRLRRTATGETDTGIAVGSVQQGEPGPVFVYSGHGSQWAGMCRGLLDVDQAFTDAIDALEPLLWHEGEFSLREVLTSSEVVTGVARVQPTLFAVQVALTAMWRERGVEPVAVIGHSMGEVAAAVACGALGVEDGVKVICRRSRLLTGVTGGAMAAVQLPAGQVREALQRHRVNGVEVAVIAAPESTVVSGDADAVEALMGIWEADGVGVARVQVDVASHSAHMDPILEELREQLSCLRPAQPHCRFYSTVAEDPRAQAGWDADYWVANQRRPVQFTAALEAAAADGHRTFVEINVHTMLAGAVSATLASAGVQVTPTLRRGGEGPVDFAIHLAALHCRGLPVPWHRWYGAGRLAEVPATCWEPVHHWIVPSALTQGTTQAGSRAETPHPLLGASLSDPQQPGRELWQSDLAPDLLAWLKDHQVANAPVMPGAVWAEMALTAARSLTPAGDSPCVRELAFDAFLPLGEDGVRLTSQSESHADHNAAWQVGSRSGEGGYEQHSRAVLVTSPPEAGLPPVPLDALREACPEPVDMVSTREAWKSSQSLSYGPAFDVLTSLHTSPQDRQPLALAAVAIPDAARAHTNRFQWHPALLDGCLQALAALWTSRVNLPEGTTYPLGIGEIQVHGPTATAAWCHVVASSLDEQHITGSVRLLDADGCVLAHADDIRVAHRPARTGTDRLQHYLHQRRWQPQEATALPRTEPGTWLALTEDAPQPWHEQLLTALTGRGATVNRLALPRDTDEEMLGNRLGSVLRQHEPAITDLVVLTRSGGANDADAVERAHQRAARVITTVQHLDRTRPTARLHLLTHHSDSVDGDPDIALDQAGVRGLHRVLAYEHPDLHPTLLDTDTHTSPDLIAAQLLAQDPEDEIAYRAGHRYVARISRSPLGLAERKSTTSLPYETPLRADADGSTLTYTVHTTTDVPPHETALTVTTHCTTDQGDALPLMPCAGTTEHSTVAALVPSAPPTSRTTTKDHWIVPVPDFLDAAHVACSLLPYLAAHYSLHHLARLTAGQHVLLHDTAASLTHAAWHTASIAHADVTVVAADGTPAPLPPGVHQLSPADLNADNTRKFDVILDGSAHPPHALAALLAPGGHLVTTHPSSRTPRTPSPNTLTSRLDLADLLRASPQTAATLLADIGEALARHDLPPLPSEDRPLDALHTSPRDTLPTAYHWPCEPVTAYIPPEDIPLVHPDGGYIVTGGLGGLGLVLCRWLAEHRAGTIVLNSRTAPTAETTRTLETLRTADTRIEVVNADIAEPGTADLLIQSAERHGHRLRGIIHAAAVVEDAAVTGITPGLLHRVWQPKSTGAWALHHASTQHPLDWWIGFSSFVPQVGSPGQAAYAAASAWLDALITHRHATGLPALGINWGAWAEVGIGARTIGKRGFHTIPPADALDGLEMLLAHDRLHSGFVEVDFDKWLAPYPQAAAAPYLSGLLQSAPTSLDDHDVLTALQAAESSQRPALLTQFITEQAAEVLRCDSDRITPHTSLVALGMDSLITVQLRNRLQQALHIAIPQEALWTKPTVASLTDHALKHLPVGHPQPSPPTP